MHSPSQTACVSAVRAGQTSGEEARRRNSLWSAQGAPLLVGLHSAWLVRLLLVCGTARACHVDTANFDCGFGLVCAPPLLASNSSKALVCRPCAHDGECTQAENVCFPSSNKPALCMHKELVPLDGHDYAGFACVFFSCALAAGGGIGGGGLLVPLLILVLSFSPHEATPLSNVAILGGAVANLLHFAPRKHPLGRKPLIHYEVALLMEPMTMLGALVGTILNKIFPGWLITVLLVVLLGATARRTMSKGLSRWRQEVAAAKLPDASAGLLKSEEGEKSLPAPYVHHELSFDGLTVEQKDLLDRLLQMDSKTPVLDISLLVLILAVFFGISLLRGKDRQDSLLNVECGSPLYWTLGAAQLLLLVVATLGLRRLLIHRHAQRELCSYPFFDCDVRWTPRATIIWPTICVAAGLVAGMFGIGGGIVKGPLMLEMGMQPAVSSATSAYMILFTSATAATQYFIFGALRLRYGAVMFVVGFCGTVVGQMGVSYLLKRWGRQSIIVIVIAVVIGFSCLMMGAVGTFDFIQGIRAGEYQGFHALCA